MQELRAAVEAGLVKIEPYGAGFLVSGAVNDLLVKPELEALGAVWQEKNQAYFVANEAAAEDLKGMEKRSKAAAAALAARQARARKDGAKVFDNQRARQQRKMARELRDVYQTALLEYQAELKAVIARYELAEDPVEAIKLGYRRDELESVIEGLAAGLANAGRSAAALTDASLPEAAAISRNVAAWQLDNMAGFRVSRMIANDTAALAITGIATYHGKFDLKAWQGVSDKRKARQTIKTAITRGLLTGEHPSKIAKRIEGLFTGDEPLSPYKRAVRIAQTETASIMNQAALETMHAANAEGVKLKKRWDATLDGSTRPDHRRVDGEVVALDEKFSNGLNAPGDGDAADRINCRCCLTEVLEGFEPDAPIRRDNITRQTTPYKPYYKWAVDEGHFDLLDNDELDIAAQRGYITQGQAEALKGAR